MFGKTAAVLALAASCVVTGAQGGLAGIRSGAGSPAGWYDTDANAALSRANPAEKVLSPATVPKIQYLRSVVAPPGGLCGSGDSQIAAPLLYGGSMYATVNQSVSKYDPATGKLIWSSALNPSFMYVSLAVSGNLLIVGGSGCGSVSEPPGIVYALNAATGARVWTSAPFGSGPLFEALKVGAYVITEGSDAAGPEISVLSLSDGTQVWHGFGCPGGPGVNPPAGLVVGMLVMSYGCDSHGDQVVQARNLATGAVVWATPGGWALQRGDLSGTSGTHLYATNPARTVVSLNPQTGQTQYSLSKAVSVLAVDASRVYATCSGPTPAVCAYDIGTGAPAWRYKTLTGKAQLAAAADGVLYLDRGVALNAATGSVIKRLPFGFQQPSALVVGDGRLGVVSDPRILDLFGLPGY